MDKTQWLMFYEKALTGTANPRVKQDEYYDEKKGPVWFAEHAERIADAAMARLEAREFPPSKVEALLVAARAAWSTAGTTRDGREVSNYRMSELGKAIAAFDDKE